jgi:pyruvate dehydrogenase E1 component
MLDEELLSDIDPLETSEWRDALNSVIQFSGLDRASFLVNQMAKSAASSSRKISLESLMSPYANSINTKDEPIYPGDVYIERRIRSLIRWNALVMVLRTNQQDSSLGGHLSSFASSAMLYDVGFNHFFRGTEPHNDSDSGNEKTDQKSDGDLIYFQGHSSPGIYARSFLEGRLTEDQLQNFRREVQGNGLSSYPHPMLMPDYWQFPTVSMGLGPLQAIYQAHFLRYLENRELIKSEGRKVWAFLGDGEMDEPESLGALSIAAREKLDNLIFVVNCNLQRLDGPVRGNGKIIEELEAIFTGFGWNVIKVVWGRRWDPLLASEDSVLLLKRMGDAIDGDYQAYKSKGGAYTREHFFGQHPELKAMVENMSDEEISQLNRGGHDPYKLYAAYAQAVSHKGQPTVILAKTIKGYGMTGVGEGQNIAHSVKKLDHQALKAFRDRFDIPIKDEDLDSLPFYRPDEDSQELKYLRARRTKLGGVLPYRRAKTRSISAPTRDSFSTFFEGSKERQVSTTMVLVRIISNLVKDKDLGPRIIPIVPDEARTFGMEGLFRQIGIYATDGQHYTPEDSEQIMYYREDPKGQILQEGINESGAMATWMAAATSYSNHNLPLIPIYMFYSMFGFQRVGDLAWAAGDLQCRGFLIGATAGRTTLNGEGLQHQDGHSHILASTIPNCVSYDPAFGYELAIIIQDGIRRMMENQENVFYYITTMNENYVQPAMPDKVVSGVISGMYPLEQPSDNTEPQLELLGSGTILNEVIAAAALLKDKFKVASRVWSVTSYNELRRAALTAERHNRLNPDKEQQTVYVGDCLANATIPVIAASDYMRVMAEQIREWVAGPYHVLGTDGFGRSDTRAQLRHYFEVDRFHIAYSALHALHKNGDLSLKALVAARKTLGIDPEKANPLS